MRNSGVYPARLGRNPGAAGLNASSQRSRLLRLRLAPPKKTRLEDMLCIGPPAADRKLHRSSFGRARRGPASAFSLGDY